MTRMTGDGAVFVGLDLGTSGLKAVALDRDGAVLARASVGYPTAHPEPGAHEQDPHRWSAAVAQAVADLSEQLPAGASVRAVGLSAMIPTMVAADGQVDPVAAALTWQDARAEDLGQRLRETVGQDEVYRTTGQWLDGRYLLPMYLGLLARDPATPPVRHLLGAKDWLLAWLTGQIATDPSTATGVGAYRLADGRWHQGLLDAAADLAGGPLPQLPQVVPSETAFPLRAQAAQALGLPAGLPVCVGGADSVVGALGLGAGRGDVAYIAGTSTAIIGLADSWQPDPGHRYIGTPLAGIDGFGLEMDLLSTGSAIRWLTGLLRLRDEAELMQLAGEVPLEEAPTVLPYLAPGEQGALWDPDLRGTIAGLTLASGPGQLARGLLTGLVLESRRCLDALGEVGVGGPVLVAGGSSRDPQFRADLADACGRPVHTPAEGGTDYSASGAARLAAMAVDEPIAAAIPPGMPHQPDAQRASLWSALSRRDDLIRIAMRSPGPAEGTARS